MAALKYANTYNPEDGRGGQNLVDHCQLVGLLSMGLAIRSNLDETQQKYGLLAGLVHDLGKGTAHFQNWITQKNRKMTQKNLDILQKTYILTQTKKVSFLTIMN